MLSKLIASAFRSASYWSSGVHEVTSFNKPGLELFHLIHDFMRRAERSSEFSVQARCLVQHLLPAILQVRHFVLQGSAVKLALAVLIQQGGSCLCNGLYGRFVCNNVVV